MSVRVRLTRVGSKKNPIWRVVVSDQRSPRDGRFIETIGHYNPQTEPSTIVIDRERLEHWLARGAQPTNTVKQLVKAHSKGVAGGTGTATAGASQAPTAVAEPEAAEPEAAEAPEAEASTGAADADAATE
jgi:small subunit ribosomal protein S16